MLFRSYVNARIFGVILVSILIGLFLTKLDLDSNKNIFTFLITSLTSGFLFIVLRGSLLQATGRAVFAIFLITFLCRNPSLKIKFPKPAQPP